MRARLLAGVAALLLVAIASRSEDTVSFSVSVHDVGGSKITGAKATLMSVNGVHAAETASKGLLIFRGIVTGTWDLEVSAPGFRNTVLWDVPVTSPDMQSINLQMTVGTSTDQCGKLTTIEYRSTIADPETHLSGHVSDEDSGKNLSAVNAELFSFRTGLVVASAKSDGAGVFTFSAVPPGRYHVRLVKEGFVHSDSDQFLVPRRTLTMLDSRLDQVGHLHICQ